VRVGSVKGSDALLQGKQTLVDFRAFEAPLPVVAFCIRTTLAAGEVNEGELPEQLLGLRVSKGYLANGVGS
jgi:hypothetical protein